jgi:hypothetical protein
MVIPLSPSCPDGRVAFGMDGRGHFKGPFDRSFKVFANVAQWEAPSFFTKRPNSRACSTHRSRSARLDHPLWFPPPRVDGGVCPRFG